MSDAASKGRVYLQVHPEAARGERNYSAKLTEKQVKEIRAQKHTTQKALAAEYGVTPALISQIQRGIIWTHIL